MSDESFPHVGRRDFLKTALIAAGVLTMPAMSGCATAGKKAPAFVSDGPLLIKNANLVDVISGDVLENAWILVEKGKITARGTGMPGAPNGHVMDMKGRYLVPGLIDAHCHSTASPIFSMKMTDTLRNARQIKRNYISAVESGITTIRDMGAFSGLLNHFKRGIEKGDMPGPRITTCNAILNVMGGHPEIPPTDMNFFAKPASLFIGMIMNNFRDTAEMEECLEDNAQGASFIKLSLDDKTLFCKKKKEIPVYSDDQLERVFRFAEKKGLPVSGHIHYKFGFDRAMAYPFNSVEHMVSDAVLTDSEVNAMARRKLAIVPTLTIGQSFLVEEAYEALPEGFRTPETLQEIEARAEYFKHYAEDHCDPDLHRQNLDAMSWFRSIGWDNLWGKKKFLMNPDIYFNMIQNGYVNLRKMKDAGVLIGCGIDAGMPFNYFGGNFREYEIFKRVGFSNLDILRCATINNARILKMEDRIGSLDAGKYADIVAYDGNPLSDIKVMRSPALVLKEGVPMFVSKDVDTGGGEGLAKLAAAGLEA